MCIRDSSCIISDYLVQIVIVSILSFSMYLICLFFKKDIAVSYTHLDVYKRQLHYQWAKQALEADKHILVEKPATTSLTATADLIAVSYTHLWFG